MTPGPRKLLEVGRRRVTLVEPCPLDLTHTLARPPTTDVSLAVAPAHRGTIAAAPPAQGAPSSLVPGGAQAPPPQAPTTGQPRCQDLRTATHGALTVQQQVYTHVLQFL